MVLGIIQCFKREYKEWTVGEKTYTQKKKDDYIHLLKIKYTHFPP